MSKVYRAESVGVLPILPDGNKWQAVVSPTGGQVCFVPHGAKEAKRIAAALSAQEEATEPSSA